MPIPSPAEAAANQQQAQKDYNEAREAAEKARKEAAEAKKKAEQAKKEAAEAKKKADEAKKKAEKAKKDAAAANEAYKNNPTPENQQAAKAANDRAAETEATAKQEQGNATKAANNASTASSDAGKAETKADKAAKKQEAASKQLQQANADQTAAQAVQAGENLPAISPAAALTTDLQAVRDRAREQMQAAHDARAEKRGNGYTFYTAADATFNIQGQQDFTVNGCRWEKASNNSMSVVIGFAISIALSANNDKRYGGTFSMIKGTTSTLTVGVSVTTGVSFSHTITKGTATDVTVGPKGDVHVGWKFKPGSDGENEDKPQGDAAHAHDTSDAVDEQENVGDESETAGKSEFNIIDMDEKVGALKVKAGKLIEEYTNLEREFTNCIYKAKGEFFCKCGGTLKVTGSGKIIGKGKGSNKMTLNGSKAEAKHGGVIAKCAGDVTLNGSKVEGK